MINGLTQVRDSITDRSCAALALDIFDTILWRRAPRPSDVFVLHAQSLRSSGHCPEWVTDATFRHMRIRAEMEAREEEYGPEVSLFDIWRKMPLELFDGSLEELVDSEVELERRVTVVDQDIANLVRVAAECQTPIALVSDTYFSDDQLRYLLDRPELLALKDARLFRSLEYRVDKGRGLWPVVLEELNLRPEQIWHVGDNEEADREVPGKLGIRCLHYVRIDERLERVLTRERQPLELYGPVDPRLDPVEGDYGLTSLRAKAVRAAPPKLGRAATTSWRYGAAVLGPVLAGFAEWVVTRAQETDTKVLWCPMREGELVSTLINNAARTRNATVEAKPLWLSRHVTSLASLDEVTRETVSDLMTRSYNLTVGQLLNTLHLRPGDVPALAGQLDTVIHNQATFGQVSAALTEMPHLLNQMTMAVTAARGRLINALRQAGALDSEDLTLVDLGWGATIQFHLARALELAHIPVVPSGLYLATEDRAARVYRRGLRAEGYLAQAGYPRDVATALARSPEVVEQCVSAACGSLIDFTDDAEPVLGPAGGTTAQNAERQAVQDGIVHFQGLWNSYVDTDREWPGLSTPSAADRLGTIMLSALQAPTSEEAQVFGNWQHEDNSGSTVVTKIAPEDLSAALAYLSPSDLDDLGTRDAFWPRLVAAADPALAAQIEALHHGHLPPGAFEASGPPFETHIRWRDPQGELHQGPARRVRINHNGLSFARLTVSGEEIDDIALSIPGRQAIVRIDWIEVRCLADRAEPHVLRWESPQDIAQLVFSQARWLGGNYVEFDWHTSAIWLPVSALVGRPVHTAQLTVAFAMLPRSWSGLEPHLPSGSTVVRLAHRAIAEYRQGGALRVANGVKSAVRRRIART